MNNESTSETIDETSNETTMEQDETTETTVEKVETDETTVEETKSQETTSEETTSKVEKEKWARMIEGYLSDRENLVAVIQLVDARHKPTADDLMMADWVKRCGYYTYVVATKLDKLKKSEIDKNLTCIYNELEIDEDCVLIPFSSENKAGREDVLELIDYILGGKAEEDR